MAKPTEPQLQQALARARQMREQDQDPHYLAKALLNCHYENGLLRAVLQAVECYLTSGLAEPEHVHLLKSLETARAGLNRSAGLEPDTFGL